MDSDPLPFDVAGISLDRVLADPDPTQTRPRRNMQARNDPLPARNLDDDLFEAARLAVELKRPIELSLAIYNTDRTVGARLAGYIAQEYGDIGLPPQTVVVHLHGSAGQSFGAFCIEGMRLDLEGEANDYVGKGMSGGEIFIRPPRTAKYPSQENAIIGNTVLYGATGGTLYAAGRAGERFAVRNSGAVAVVEGVGDHACEYMTGGTVVVLGTFGRNFGAGMTGGAAFVYDRESKLPVRLNPELVHLERLDGDEDEAWLRDLVNAHADATGSAWARTLHWRWGDTAKYFWKVVPK